MIKSVPQPRRRSVRSVASCSDLKSAWWKEASLTIWKEKLLLEVKLTGRKAALLKQDKKELWPSKLKRLLKLAGLGDIRSAKTNTPATMSYIRLRLLDVEQQTWISEIHNDERKDPQQKNKVRTFRKFKLTHDYENYLTNVRNINHRVAITKLRLSNQKLAIETGRYVKPYQPPDQRICPLCKTGLEDEEHFLMNCIGILGESCSIR